jgi:hypothetical protein
MASLSPELLDQIESWSLNLPVTDLISMTWTDSTFLQPVAVFCVILTVFWTLMVVILRFDREFIIEKLTAFIHAMLNSVVSCVFLLNHSEMDIIQMNLDRQTNPNLEIPSTMYVLKLFLTFQAAYCIMDNAQLAMGIIFQRQRIKYRVTLIVHHLLVLLCCSGTFLLDPWCHHFYAKTSLIEVSTVFLHLRNFGKMMDNATIYFVGGLGTLITYPLLRIIIPLRSAYIIYYGPTDRFLSDSLSRPLLVFNGFVFAMSLYYTVFVLWADPTSIYRLKHKKVE